MAKAEQRQFTAEYVRKRLTDECASAYGMATEISRRTGFSAPHISKVIDGKTGIGYEFATALGEYWGLSYAELEQEALENAARGGALAPHQPIEPLPNLRSTILFLRGSYPDAFLSAFEAEARGAQSDRPRVAWIDEIRAKYWQWREGNPGVARSFELLGRSTSERSRVHIRVPRATGNTTSEQNPAAGKRRIRS